MNIIFFTLVALLVAGQSVSAQNECCSRFGFCGTGPDFCGADCRSGPCEGNGGKVADIVTEDFFNGIANQAPPTGCPGRSGFYTRSIFLQALEEYPTFGTQGSPEDSKREIAAFFAHVTHETGNMCYIEEREQSNIYCDPSKGACAPGKAYYGRGALQLTWNYNYASAGNSLKFDGVNNPEIVATDAVISFKASVWLWMENCHNAIISGQGFGATILGINGDLECKGRDPNTVAKRVGYYRDYCTQLGVDPGTNLEC